MIPTVACRFSYPFHPCPMHDTHRRAKAGGVIITLTGLCGYLMCTESHPEDAAQSQISKSSKGQQPAWQCVLALRRTASCQLQLCLNCLCNPYAARQPWARGDDAPCLLKPRQRLQSEGAPHACVTGAPHGLLHAWRLAACNTTATHATGSLACTRPNTPAAIPIPLFLTT